VNLEFAGTGYGSAGSPTARRVELFADWIETQVLLAESPLSKPEFVDRLEGSGRVHDSDDAWVLIDDAFLACRRRQRVLGQNYPFSIAGSTIEPSDTECMPYRFCLLASLPEQFQPLRTSYPKEFRDLFEHLVAHALRSILPGWNVYPTGWAGFSGEGKRQIVQKIATWSVGKCIDETVFPHANDAQVDVAVVRSFTDGRTSVPVLLGQCATGVTDWRDKLARPNIDRWCSAVQFSARPVRLFAVPFALDEISFREAVVESNGLVLDRVRICESSEPVPSDLAQKISDWLLQASALMPIAA